MFKSDDKKVETINSQEQGGEVQALNHSRERLAKLTEQYEEAKEKGISRTAGSTSN
jgi:hypothetical protein